MYKLNWMKKKERPRKEIAQKLVLWKNYYSRQTTFLNQGEKGWEGKQGNFAAAAEIKEIVREYYNQFYANEC